MNFELVISGLCIIAMKTSTGEDRPEQPSQVDIICPSAPFHCARLSYLPKGIIAQVQPELVVDESGKRIASLDLSRQILEISFSSNPRDQFAVRLGSSDLQQPPPDDVLNFIPTLNELGFDGFVMPQDGDLPIGAVARITLPPGEILAADIVLDPDSGKVVLWDFPEKATTHALANHVIYRATGVGDLAISNADGPILEASGNVPIWMSVSNDDCNVPLDFNDPVEALKDLIHLRSVAMPRGPFKTPVIHKDQRTGRPICNQVIHSYGG